MSQGREQIYSTLFTSLVNALLVTPVQAPGAIWQAAGTPTLAKPFLVASRRTRPLGTLGKGQYPCFYFYEKGEEYQRRLIGGPPIVTFVSYIRLESNLGDDPNLVTAVEVNNLADAVEDAVEGALPGTNRLGGLVFECWISGREVVEVSTGPNRFSAQILEIETIVTH